MSRAICSHASERAGCVQVHLSGEWAAAVAESTRSAPDALSTILRREMADQNLTFRALAERTKRVDRRGLSNAFLSELATGAKKRTTRATLEVIADALKIDPGTIAEYRLLDARDRLDPEVVGIDEAMAALEVFEQSAPSAGTGRRAPVPDSLRRRARAGQPTRADLDEVPERGAA